MSWIQVHVTVHQPQVEWIEALLNELGALSISLSDAGDEPMLEPLPGETPIWTASKVSALFSEDYDVEQLNSALAQSLTSDDPSSFSIETLPDQAWERTWLKRFQPRKFGSRLWICPTGYAIKKPDALVVQLDPGLAFGTGTHPTTQLCLEWLATTDIQNKVLIDFGCGSGILAIAALKSGAKRVIGIDHDPQALIASQANAEKNAVAHQLQLVSSLNALKTTPIQADVVLANILANAFITQRDQIMSVLKPQGQFIMSGLLQQQLDNIIQHYQSDVAVVQTQRQDDWYLLHTQKIH